MEGPVVNMRRRCLTVAISSLLTEIGFETAENAALETMVEMVQSFLTELGGSSRSYCELAGRTEPMIGDVILGLVNMGIKVDGIQAHALRTNRTVLVAPTQSTQPKQLTILQAGVKQSHPSHIPAHLPAFPDPHAYIRTPTHKQPVTEYEAIREKSACQKRDLERALTRFVAKTGDTHSLFDNDDSQMFPLIACKTDHPAYLKALLPQDQVFDSEDEFAVAPSFPSPRQPPPRKRAASGGGVEGEGDGDEDEEEEEEEEAEEGKEGDGKGGDNDVIDNPYLRPVKLPRK